MMTELENYVINGESLNDNKNFSKKANEEKSRNENIANDIYLAKTKKLELLNDTKKRLEVEVIKL